VEHIVTRSADGVGPIRQLVARAVLRDAATPTNSRDGDVTDSPTSDIEPFGELPSTKERQNAVAATPAAVSISSSSSSSVIGSSRAG